MSAEARMGVNGSLPKFRAELKKEEWSRVANFEELNF